MVSSVLAIHCRHLLGRLVSQTSWLSLATTNDVPCEAFCAVEITHVSGSIIVVDSHGPIHRSLDDWPDGTDPMTVAPVHKLVRASSNTPFWCILPGREPADKIVKVQVLFQGLVGWSEKT